MANNRKKALWILTVVFAVALIVGIALLVVGSRVSRIIEDRLQTEAAERGFGIQLERASVSASGDALVRELCVSFLDDDHFDVCVDEVRVSADRTRLLSRDVEVRAVRAGVITLDTSDARVRALAENLRDEDAQESESSEDEEQRSPISSLRRVEVNALHVALRVGDEGFNASLRDIAAHRNDEQRWDSSAQADAIELPDGTPEPIHEALADIAIDLSAVLDEGLRPEEAALRFSSPLSLQFDSQRSVGLAALRFEAPWSIIFEEARSNDELMTFEARELEVELTSWPSSLDELKFANATIRGMAASVDTSSIRARFGAEEPGATEAEESEESEASRSATEDAGDDAAALSPLALYLEDKRWWEALPAAINIEDSELRLAIGEEDFVLDELNLRYALRVIQRQMDLTLDARLMKEGSDQSATLSVDGEWAYDRGELEADLVLGSLPLPWLNDLIPQLPLRFDAGEATQALEVATRDDGYAITHELELEGLRADVPLLSEPLSLSSLQSESAFSYRQQASETTRSAGQEVSYTLETTANTIQVGEAQLSLRPTLEGLRVGSSPSFERVIVELEIPDQDIATLWRAIPASLLGESAGAEMRGNYGLDWRFAISRETSEAGTRYEVHPSSELDIRDESLQLVSLPEAVDVRRLNEAMRFVFRGPEDEIMRELQLAPPRWIGGPYRGVPSGSESTPEGWTRLDAISFYLIAAQLYREDGSFFTNSGVNWFQLRRVIGEALTEGELGRGASTISMQLVKNVFLSHERTLERKLQELFLTYWMTRIVPKERILEVYLNVIEWGPGVNGATEAARFYFNRSITELDVLDAVWLSHITPNPVVLGRGRPRPSLEPGDCSNCDRIVLRMHERGWIDDFELRRAQGQSPLDLQPMALPPLGNAGPPLLEALNEPEEESLARMGPRSRLMHWIENSRRLRGAGPAPR